MLRRLSEADVNEVVESHRGGASIDSLAYRFGVHRTTILHHLDRRGVPRPPATRKMTDRTVRQAAVRYQTGDSLKVVAAQYGVDARTLGREFDRAGIQTPPRRGWPPLGRDPFSIDERGSLSETIHGDAIGDRSR